MFRGSLVALVTPMGEDGAIDYEAFGRLIDWHCTAGTHGLVVAGTTGESPTLDFDEHVELVRFAVVRAAGRRPVIAGTGSNSTREALFLTEAAARDGADACLLVTPYYNKPTQEGLYRHFRLLAEQVAIPQILYNVPGRTAVDLLPETVERLAELPNVVGIKEASGSLERIRRLRALCPPPFAVYSGDDALAAAAMLEGADGVISVTANVAPEAMVRMAEAALAGEREAAERLDAPLQGLHQALFLEANPIPVKWALHAMGRIGPGIRLPLTPFSEVHHESLRAALRAAAVLD